MNKRPVVLIVMDGVGLSNNEFGNAVKAAYTPTLDRLFAEYPNIAIKASGVAVGLPSDSDMGNSEVGHNAIGCGQIYSQGAKLVNESIDSKAIYDSETWKELVKNCANGTLHFMGLLSDGGVHSHIHHLEEMIKEAKAEGVKKVRLHILLDGRDVPETSALQYVDEIENLLNELRDASFDCKVASGGGRMVITMDRYEADWDMVKRGWDIHVLGEGRQFASAKEAIETYRNELGCNDQNLPGFVIAEDGKAVGTIEDGDSVVYFNFRGDRALEISRAFEGDASFKQFDRVRVPKVYYAGMLQYDGDLKIPTHFLVNPPKIQHTMSEYFIEQGVRQYAISETQKFGHVTYFWNGNRSEKFDETMETWVEVKSDVVPFNERPWMKASEVTDLLCEAIEKNEYNFYRCNYPNGDMVGHTGDFLATRIGVEAVDLNLKRVLESAAKVNALVLVTADHGNADEMYEKKKSEDAPLKPKTSHTLNKVPFIIADKSVALDGEGDYGLANIAATVAELMDIEPLPMWEKSMLKK